MFIPAENTQYKPALKFVVQAALSGVCGPQVVVTTSADIWHTACSVQHISPQTGLAEHHDGMLQMLVYMLGS